MSAAGTLRQGSAAAADVAQRFAELLRSKPARSGVTAPQRGSACCAVAFERGLHAGACVRLRGPVVRIGSARDNDIVLHDAGVLPQHAELRRVDGMWLLCAAATGAPLAPIQTSRKGACVRERHLVGDAGLVVSQCARSAQVAPAVRRPARWQKALAPCLFVLAAALGAAVIVQLVKPAAASVPEGSRSLAAEGWPDVLVTVDASRRAAVSGHVDTAEDLVRLKAWLPLHGLAGAAVTPRVGNELAVRVREALADDTLSVAYVGGGIVRVQGSSANLAVRTRLQRLRADLAGAVVLEDRVAYSEAVEPPRRKPLPVRIVGVMPGENGSFSTEDGGHYFVGAVLSDGAEVIAIRADGIEFKVGEKTVNYPLK